jgi:hypothetical protein
MSSSTLLGLDAQRADYKVDNVRWTQYFTADGMALHENYWKPRDTFGIPSSHGCAGLVAEDARFLLGLGIGGHADLRAHVGFGARPQPAAAHRKTALAIRRACFVCRRVRSSGVIASAPRTRSGASCTATLSTLARTIARAAVRATALWDG